MSAIRGVKRSCDSAKSAKHPKRVFIGPKPQKNSYEHALWTVNSKLPEMRQIFKMSGRSNIEQNDNYSNRFKKAWRKIYQHDKNAKKPPVYNGEQYGTYCEMKDCCRKAQTEFDPSKLRKLLELAWDKYTYLKETQEKQSGGVHKDLCPPALRLAKVDSAHRCSVEKAPPIQFIPEATTMAESSCNTDLTYTKGHTWTKTTFEVPDLTAADPLPPPFNDYRPEQYLKTHLEGGGFNDYCKETQFKSGKSYGMYEGIRFESMAQTVWQQTINHMAEAHNRDYSLAVATSQMATGLELLRELHRRLCRKMTSKKSLKTVVSATETPDDNATCSLEMSDEKLEQIEQTVEQQKGVAGVAKATVDMSRFTFTQIEKGLMKRDILRKPAQHKDAKKYLERPVIYEIQDQAVAKQFFKQALKADEPILCAIADGREFTAEISAIHPMKFGHRGTKSCSPCKVWIEIYYSIRTL